MKTARNKMKEATSLLMSLMLVAGLSGNAMAAPATPAGQAVNSAATQPATADAPATGDAQTPAPVMQPASAETAPVIPTDLSVMGMYHHADVVVKTVMTVCCWLLWSPGHCYSARVRKSSRANAVCAVNLMRCPPFVRWTKPPSRLKVSLPAASARR